MIAMEEDVSNLFTPTPTPHLPLGQVAANWKPPIHPSSPALQGLAPNTLSAILDAVPVEHVVIFVSTLTTTPQPVDAVRHALLPYDWFPKASRDTQLRRIRTLQRAAVARKHPVVTTNDGIWLGGPPELRDAGARCRGQGIGCFERADELYGLADELELAALAGQP